MKILEDIFHILYKSKTVTSTGVVVLVGPMCCLWLWALLSGRLNGRRLFSLLPLMISLVTTYVELSYLPGRLGGI